MGSGVRNFENLATSPGTAPVVQSASPQNNLVMLAGALITLGLMGFGLFKATGACKGAKCALEGLFNTKTLTTAKQTVQTFLDDVGRHLKKLFSGVGEPHAHVSAGSASKLEGEAVNDFFAKSG
jgi:hypothetical protein